MTQQPTLFDLSRGKAAPTSQAAYEKVRPAIRASHQRILAWLKTCGDRGGTLKEFAALVGKQVNCISGRFSELHKAGVIVRGSDVRDDCAVWRLTEQERANT